MRNRTPYIISMVITTLLTVGAYLALLVWAGRVISDNGQSSFFALLPWLPVLLLLLTALNCMIRKRIIKNWR